MKRANAWFTPTPTPSSRSEEIEHGIQPGGKEAQIKLAIEHNWNTGSNEGKPLIYCFLAKQNS